MLLKKRRLKKSKSQKSNSKIILNNETPVVKNRGFLYYYGMDIKEAFRQYLHLGYKPILLAPKSKKPILRAWNLNYQPNYYLNILRKSNNFNLGFLLGEVVDIEGDSAGANKFLNKFLADIPHPIFKSFKSTHHLFKNFPGNNITRFNARGIEIRAFRHQSVVPPSIHESDCNYEWQTRLFHNFEIPYLNKQILSGIYNFCGCKQIIVKPGNIDIKCGICSKINYINKKRLESELKIFKMDGMKWACHKCRPNKITERIRLFRSTMI